MTDARPQLISAASNSRTLALAGASLLIFVGLMFQLGEFVCNRLSAPNYWLIHMIATNLWNTIVLRLNAVGVGDMLRYWPLMLVGFGFAILLALNPSKR